MAQGRGRNGGGSGPVRGTTGVSDERSRAQTTIDFMIGAGVFLLVVGFVLGVIPGMIDPFSGSQETTLVADRLATQISEGMLAEPDQPTVLNQTCVTAFFNSTGPAEGEGCPVPFDEDATDLPQRLGVNDQYSINVTIERNTVDDPQYVVQYTDGETVSDTGHTRLGMGDSPPSTSSMVIASRTAFIDGKDVRVVVRVW